MSRPWRGARARRSRRPAPATRSAPLKIEGVTRATALRVVYLNYGSACGVARILNEPDCSPPGDPDEAEVIGVSGQRRVALEPPPVRYLPRSGCQEASVAGDFNLRGMIDADLNGASSISAAAGNIGSSGHRISMCRLQEYG